MNECTCKRRNRNLHEKQCSLYVPPRKPIITIQARYNNGYPFKSKIGNEMRKLYLFEDELVFGTSKIGAWPHSKIEAVFSIPISSILSAEFPDTQLNSGIGQVQPRVIHIGYSLDNQTVHILKFEIREVRVDKAARDMVAEIQAAVYQYQKGNKAWSR